MFDKLRSAVQNDSLRGVALSCYEGFQCLTRALGKREREPRGNTKPSISLRNYLDVVVAGAECTSCLTPSSPRRTIVV